MTLKHIMTHASVELVILDAVNRPGGATWRQIKEAVLQEGMTPTNWLTQVRGPLQALMNEGSVQRINSDYESERYVIATESNQSLRA